MEIEILNTLEYLSFLKYKLLRINKVGVRRKSMIFKNLSVLLNSRITNLKITNVLKKSFVTFVVKNKKLNNEN
jgi:hypothetical protein